MMRRIQITKTWFALLLLLAVMASLVACSGGDQMLLAEFNRDGQAEIFLTKAGAEAAEWQSLVQDVEHAFMFPGELAAFVPDTNRIVLWYNDRNDLRIEQMKIGDDAPVEIYEANAGDRVFGTIESDPFAIYLTETENFESYRCYVSLEGAEAERLTRGGRCTINKSGVVLVDADDRGTTVTVVSLDGEDETVILDEVEDIGGARFNSDLSTFVYAEFGRRDVQLFLIEPGDAEGVAFGNAFAEIDTFGFLADDKTVYAVGKLNEDDDWGLFINGTGEPILEAEDISWGGQQEGGDHAIFLTEDRGETAVHVYSLKDGTVTEITEKDEVSVVGFVNEDWFLLRTTDRDNQMLLSVRSDGSEVIELLDTNDYDIQFMYMNRSAEQLLVQLRDQEGVDTIYVTSWSEENGYFLLEEWAVVTLLSASDEYLVFSGREGSGDDVFLFSIPLAEDATEIELDDDARTGFRYVFFAGNGRSIYYTALDDGLDDTEVRTVPVDGSERAEGLYRDVLLLDVSWEGEPNLQLIR